MIRKYGFRRDHPLLNRRMYSLVNPDNNVTVLAKADLTSQMPAVYDQGQLGSCTANAASACIQFLDDSIKPSRLFIYYNERVLDGDPRQDGGSSLSSAIYVLKQQGVCSETTWAYIEDNVFVRPNKTSYAEAIKDQLLSDFSIQTLEEMKQCLSAGFPFMFGFSVFQAFESEEMAANPIMTMPAEDEESIGGHAVTAVGFDNETQMFKIRNSWGPDWGDNGYFFMPFSFITNPAYASDFWTMRKMEIE